MVSAVAWDVCERCADDDVVGIRLPDTTRCWAHADDQEFDAASARLGDDGVLDARGVPITADLLARILAAAPRDPERPDRPRLEKARFDHAKFGDHASFAGVNFGEHTTVDDHTTFMKATFGDHTSFAGARFGYYTRFEGATFGDHTIFTSAKFGGIILFEQATFGDHAWFEGIDLSHGVTFREATFGNHTTFARTTFGLIAVFVEATFGDHTRFDIATLGDHAMFDRAVFSDVGFRGTTFGYQARFEFATFGDQVDFDGATFGDQATFGGATFGDQVNFGGATFGNGAMFGGATFGNHAKFGSVTFDDRVSFVGATFGDQATFNAATFGDLAAFGPILVCGDLTLQQTTFGRLPQLAISANRVRCEQAKFPDGAYLRVRWAELTLDSTQFGSPSILAKGPPFAEFDDDQEESLVTLVRAGGQSHRTDQPRLICLAGSDVTNLAINDCDLRACRFIGAHNLAALRLESLVVLPTTPTRWRRGRTWPPVWRWARRQTIAEEHHWRQQQPKRAGWVGADSSARSPYAADWHHHEWRDDSSGSNRPAEIAAAYRALRKGREDTNDEPGAADFYYGEMEMRRHDRTKSVAERLVLLGYWLLSGYALRASRALAWLAGILILATVLLASVGFQPVTPLPQATSAGTPPLMSASSPPSGIVVTDRSFPARLGIAALVAAEGAVFRASEQGLTYRGRLIQAVLRFVGPILLALAVLSVRGRVKR